MNSHPATQITVLGGLNEVGMNCMIVEDPDSALMIDCGISFGDRRYGIERIYPSMDYAVALGAKLKAVVLTHGHLDHIGALPFLAAQRPLEIYGTPYTLALAQHTLDEYPRPHKLQFHDLTIGKVYRFGGLSLRAHPIAHSIIDSAFLIVESAAGKIVHSGDFRLSLMRDKASGAQEKLLKEIGAEGISLLLSDSTNSTVAEELATEDDVTAALENVAKQTTGRLVVTLFPSNIERLQHIFDIAVRCKRKVALLGLSLHIHTKKAFELGRLHLPETSRIDEDKLQDTTRHKVLAIVAGSQGDPRSALRRLAENQHPKLQLAAGDTVVLSSRTIPGNEKDVIRIIDAFADREVRVLPANDYPELHASGHAPQADQRRLMQCLKPTWFMPIHGTPYLLRRHRELAEQAGIKNTLIARNGDRITLDRNGVAISDKIDVGRVFLSGEWPVEREAFRRRRQMAEFGVVFIALQKVRGATPGFGITTLGLAEITSDAQKLHAHIVSLCQTVDASAKFSDSTAYSDAIVKKVRRYFQKEFDISPWIQVVWL